LGTAAQQALGTAQEINRIQPGTEAVKAVTPVLGGAAGAVGQVASDLGQAAQGAVSGAAQGVSEAAAPVLGAAQDINRLTHGTASVSAKATVLGGAPTAGDQVSEIVYGDGQEEP
jgi:hypothetical protein